MLTSGRPCQYNGLFLELLTSPASFPEPQLYKLGNKMELLVAVSQADRKNPDSPVTVNITTTLPDAGEPRHAH